MSSSTNEEVNIASPTSSWRPSADENEVPVSRCEEVFQKLKLRYDYLNDSLLQQCFLYCALLPDYKLEDLIEYLIDEGIIEGMESRRAEFDKGISMLFTLDRARLLEIDEDDVDLSVTMKGLMRDMAKKILRLKWTVMVEDNKKLEEVTHAGMWTDDLMRISLMRNDIKEIPSGHSPTCPNLSTLFLNDNLNLEFIADSFFKQLWGLKVLDLSQTAIMCLPSSISNLVNLKSLLLKRCKKLRHVPSLAKLKILRRLDMSYSGLKELPEGIELLTNLKYLDLYATQVELQAGILPKLSNLQFLRVGSNEIPIAVKGEEVACLKKLEVLSCCFNDVDNFDIYFQSVKKRQLQNPDSIIDQVVDDYLPSEYNVCVGIKMGGNQLSYSFDARHGKRVLFFECNINRGGAKESQLILPENIERLDIINCSGGRSLLLENATQLKELFFSRHDGIEFFSSSAMFQKLRTLCLGNLNNLHALFGTPPTITPFPTNGTFSCLKNFEIGECPNITKLFPPGLLPNLQNLKYIVVEDCKRMEEIIASEEQGYQQFSLPNLEYLRLTNLPKLKSICSGQMICDSLEKFYVDGCIKLINPQVYKNGERFYAKNGSDEENDSDDDVNDS